MRVGRPIADFVGVARTIARVLPAALCALLALRLGSRIVRTRIRSGRDARSLALLVLTFALGPGLLVNGLLKPNSHRPRPIHTLEVAGAGDPYRPFYAFDGACPRNCSFASGETAAAAWTFAPAMLAPPALRAPAVVMALVFSLLVSAMRLMAGAHFLSDVAFSMLAISLLILAGRAILRPGEVSVAASLARPREPKP